MSGKQKFALAVLLVLSTLLIGGWITLDAWKAGAVPAIEIGAQS